MKRDVGTTMHDYEQVEKMIKSGDLFFQSTKTKRATNADKLSNLDKLLKKDYTAEQLQLSRLQFDHNVMQGLNSANKTIVDLSGLN